MSRAVGFCLLIAIACRRSPEAPFVDITGSAGLDGPVPSYDAALADFDGDGRIDIYVGNHGAGAALYRNLGDGRFENVIPTAGIEPGGDQHGAGWGDLDGDGRPDLYVGLGADRGRGTKANRLYQNVGGRFVDVAGAAGAADPRGRARGVSWVDYDRDGRLDVFVANYASPNVLLHNSGDGTFEDRAEAAGLARPGAGRAVWTDYDHDGWPDVLFTATPAGVRLLHNEGDGRFRDATDQAGLPRWPPAEGAAFADVDGDGDLDLVLAAGTDFPDSFTLREGSLVFAVPGRRGIAIRVEGPREAPPAALYREGILLADAPPLMPEGRGWTLRWSGPGRLAGRIGPGITTASLEGARAWGPREPHRLYLNRGDGTFVEAVGALAGRGNGQAVAWADVDNDGDLDLYVVQSGVEGADEPDLLYLNDGHGHFTPTTGVPAGEGRGCGAHFADFDGDGRLDLLLTTGWGVPPLARGPHRLLRNVAPPAHWLEVTLVGRASNHAGLGAWIDLEADGQRQTRFRSGGTLYSQSLLPEHFGLGNATDAHVRVDWPSGTSQEVIAAADRQIEIVESRP